MESAALLATRIDDQLQALVKVSATKALSDLRNYHTSNGHASSGDRGGGGGNESDNHDSDPDYVVDFKVEFEVLIEFLFCMLTIGMGKATPGMRALGVFYKHIGNDATSATTTTAAAAAFNDRRSDDVLRGDHSQEQVQGEGLPFNGSIRRGYSVYVYFAVIYMFKKLKSKSILYNWKGSDKNGIRKFCATMLSRVEVASNSAALLNFILFIRNGQFPSILHRFLDLQLTAKKQHSNGLDPSLSTKSHFTNTQLNYTAKIIMFSMFISFMNSLTIIQEWPELTYIRRETTAVLCKCVNYTSETISSALSKVPFYSSITNKIGSLFRRKKHGQNLGNNGKRKTVRFDPNMSIYSPLSPSVSDMRSETEEIDEANEFLSDYSTFTSESVFATSRIRPSLLTSPSVCTACLRSPAERGHALPCGHIYCYLCLRYSRSDSSKSHKKNKDITKDMRSEYKFVCICCSSYHSRYIVFSHCQPLAYLVNNL